MQQTSELPTWPRAFIWSCLAVLLGTLGLSAMAVWPPTIANQPGSMPVRDALIPPTAPKPVALPQEQAEHEPPPTAVRRALRCAECGVVNAVREIPVPGQSALLGQQATAVQLAVGDMSAETGRTFEISVRMSDGSPHVFIDSTPGNWRPGDRMIRIEGAGSGSP